MKYRLLLLPPLAALIIFFTVYASSKDGSKNPEQTSYQAALRMIGHKLLLSSGDTRSRVLPIKQLAGNMYQLQFENPLSLQPDSVFNIISKTIKLSSRPDDYTADVLECSGNGIVYSFVMSHIDSNVIVPCLGRTLPEGCYYINISFASSKPTTSTQAFIWISCIALLLLSGYSIYSYFKTKKNRIHAEGGPVANETITIGKFLFYPSQRYLEIQGERVDLTDKESKLLSILALAPNTAIDREKFQKEVWENEGVIVTRSLDVFISRLRKKLDKDGTIKLVNVHGKGYKLELPV